MTRTLLKLQATLWRRTVAGNGSSIAMIVIVSVYGLIGLLSMSALLVLGIDEGRTGVLAGVVAMGTFAYVVAAVMWPSGEGQLSADSFATLSIGARELLPAFAISTLMQSRGILAVLCTVVTAVVASIMYPLALAPVIWIMLLLALVMTLLLGELVASLATGSSSRISKERAGVYATVGFFVLIIGYQLLAGSGAMQHLDVFGRAVRWTPFASTAGAVEAAEEGRWAMAAVFLGLSLAYLGLGAWLWRTLVERALSAPLDRGGRSGPGRERRHRESDSVLFLPGVPHNAGGAVYSRAIRYLFRDSRLLSSLLIFPVFTVLFIVQGVTIGEFIMYTGLVFVAIFGGSVAVNDFGYDGSGIWVNMSSGASTRSLLLPRHWASVTPAAVSIAIYSVIALSIADNRVVLLLVLGITVGIFLTTAAVSLFTTVFNPFATARPGTSPWGDKSGYSGAAFISAFASLLLGWVPSLPAIAVTSIGYQSEMPWVVLAGQILAIAIPAILYAVVVRLCLKRVDARMPEIFDKVKRSVG
ncbi:hypothetical protein [Corynebacterium pacaense]|uniref:hypothetical protein n=1 Tax=Corynebacterium pacaense TaxID=1816684 RepID=UPI0009BB820B|nr:hypothetical protein [Corynebacterium pacaense]